jgi:hypothetical protein
LVLSQNERAEDRADQRGAQPAQRLAAWNGLFDQRLRKFVKGMVHG